MTKSNTNLQMSTPDSISRTISTLAKIAAQQASNSDSLQDKEKYIKSLEALGAMIWTWCNDAKTELKNTQPAFKVCNTCADLQDTECSKCRGTDNSQCNCSALSPSELSKLKYDNLKAKVAQHGCFKD